MIQGINGLGRSASASTLHGRNGKSNPLHNTFIQPVPKAIKDDPLFSDSNTILRDFVYGSGKKKMHQTPLEYSLPNSYRGKFLLILDQSKTGLNNIARSNFFDQRKSSQPLMESLGNDQKSNQVSHILSNKYDEQLAGQRINMTQNSESLKPRTESFQNIIQRQQPTQNLSQIIPAQSKLEASQIMLPRQEPIQRILQAAPSQQRTELFQSLAKRQEPTQTVTQRAPIQNKPESSQAQIQRQEPPQTVTQRAPIQNKPESSQAQIQRQEPTQTVTQRAPIQNKPESSQAQIQRQEPTQTVTQRAPIQNKPESSQAQVQRHELAQSISQAAPHQNRNELSQAQVLRYQPTQNISQSTPIQKISEQSAIEQALNASQREVTHLKGQLATANAEIDQLNQTVRKLTSQLANSQASQTTVNKPQQIYTGLPQPQNFTRVEPVRPTHTRFSPSPVSVTPQTISGAVTPRELNKIQTSVNMNISGHNGRIETVSAPLHHIQSTYQPQTITQQQGHTVSGHVLISNSISTSQYHKAHEYLDRDLHQDTMKKQSKQAQDLEESQSPRETKSVRMNNIFSTPDSKRSRSKSPTVAGGAGGNAKVKEANSRIRYLADENDKLIGRLHQYKMAEDELQRREIKLEKQVNNAVHEKKAAEKRMAEQEVMVEELSSELERLRSALEEGHHGSRQPKQPVEEIRESHHENTEEYHEELREEQPEAHPVAEEMPKKKKKKQEAVADEEVALVEPEVEVPAPEEKPKKKKKKAQEEEPDIAPEAGPELAEDEAKKPKKKKKKDADVEEVAPEEEGDGEKKKKKKKKDVETEEAPVDAEDGEKKKKKKKLKAE